MGNQLVSLAPSQIFPVEHYIQDIQVHNINRSVEGKEDLLILTVPSPVAGAGNMENGKDL